MPYADTALSVTGPPAGAVPLGSADELRAILGTPHPVVIDKVHDRLTDEDRDLLARSPAVHATSDAAGNCDSTPRGGAPGFTHVLDAATIALPDRPGNRVEIDEIFRHCPASLRRSGVWAPETWESGART